MKVTEKTEDNVLMVSDPTKKLKKKLIVTVY